MNPRNSEPTTEAPTADDEEVPPWPERGPEVAAAKAAAGRDDDNDDDRDSDDEDDGGGGPETATRATVPQPDPEPIPLPGPDPVPDPVPHPEPDPAPPPGPDPQPEPDPAPEPGPVTEPAPQAVGTDEGSADLDDAPQLELAVHEEPEAEVGTVDRDVDVELDVETAGDTDDELVAEELLDHTDGPGDAEDAAEVAATAALAAVGAEGLVERPFPEPPAPTRADVAVGWPRLTDAGAWEGRWTSVQAAFVDDPARSIQQADRLVTEAMEEVARLLLARRESLQDRWRTGADDAPPDTEQLRVTIQGYRALLFGLLSTEPVQPA